MTLLGYGAFFHTSPVMYVVYITFQAGRPSRVGPYAGPGRGVFYKLRVARSDVVSLSLSRRYAASESAKKAVARGSWSVARKSSPSFRMGCGQISQRAALWDGPYELRATNYEQQKSTSRRPTYPVAPTRKTGGSADGYKPLLLKASVSRRWLSLCSSHCAFHSSRIPKGIAPTQIRT